MPNEAAELRMLQSARAEWLARVYARLAGLAGAGAGRVPVSA